MDSIKKTHKILINEILPSSYAFICFASFEGRSVSVPLALNTKAIDRAFVLRNVSHNAERENKENVEQICNYIHCHELIDLNLSIPASVADAIAEVVRGLVNGDKKTVVVDISTFTHEALLILLKLLHDNMEKLDKIYCLYNGASKYSGGVSPNEIWLSKGCRDVRNVIGYPGLLKPSSKNHLILLTGYEYERATRLIEILEPDLLSLGDGNEPTDSNHEKAMDYFKEKFKKWKDGFQGVVCNSFPFSCSNVEETIVALNQIIEKFPNENYIIVPLNTKLSTVASAMVALHDNRIQLCYAIPEMYNSQQYSTPSDNVTIINLNKIDSLFQQP